MVDGKGHLLGRLVSNAPKALLAYTKRVEVRAEQVSIRGLFFGTRSGSTSSSSSAGTPISGRVLCITARPRKSSGA